MRFTDGVHDGDAARYHDLGPILGEPGIGLAVPGRDPLVALALARPRSGIVAFIGRGDAQGDPVPAFRRALATPTGDDLSHEAMALALLAPCPVSGTHGTDPSRQARRSASARDAFRSVPLPADMRAALLSLTENGLPGCLGAIATARAATGDGRWDLLSFFSGHPALSPALDGRVLRAACGGGGAREALAAEWPGLDAARLRRLRGRGHRPLGAVGASGLPRESFGLVMAAVAAIPPESVPSGPSWLPFSLLARMTGGLARTLGLDVATLLGPGGPDWEAYAARVMGHPMPHGDDMQRWISMEGRRTLLESEAADPPASMAEDLVVPLLCHVATRRSGRDAAWSAEVDDTTVRMRSHDLQNLAYALSCRLLYGGRSLARVVEVSSAWHAPGATVGRASPSAPGYREWPALTGEVRLAGAIRVACIHRPSDLAAEGSHGEDRDGVAGLGHCVATRLSRYRAGEAHLLSVRRDLPDGTWERLSCAEVTVSGRAMQVVEHRGRHNAAPPREADDAMATVGAMVASGALVPEPAALVRRVSAVGSLPDRCGYEWRDPKAVAAALDSWESLLPRWLRGHAPEGAVDVMVAEGVLDPAWDGLFSAVAPPRGATT